MKARHASREKSEGSKHKKLGNQGLGRNEGKGTLAWESPKSRRLRQSKGAVNGEPKERVPR